MSRFIDLTGQKFGSLTVLYRLHNSCNKYGVSWLCTCDCGNLVEVLSNGLRSGNTKSCGCSHAKHGKSDTRLYRIWKNMKTRCYNKNYERYNDYGGRSIKICDEWLNDFQAFYDWAVNNDYKENLTIDRIDNNKGYSPDNCRWATRKQQTRNRRNTMQFAYKGETKSLAEWCEVLNLNYKTINNRIYSGLPIEKALELEERHDFHNNNRKSIK